MSNAMTLPESFGELTTMVGNMEEYAALKRPAFLQQLRFYSKGKSFGDGGFIPPGHYGVALKDGAIEDLGNKIDVLPLASKPKAMDFGDLEHIIATSDATSNEYQRIKHSFLNGGKDIAWGPSFLVVERNTGQLYELFCGSKTLGDVGNALLAYLPLTAGDCARSGIDADQARGASPATLTSKKVESSKYKSWWFVGTASKCSVPFTSLPEEGTLIAELKRFITVTQAEVEAVAADEAPARAY